MKASKLFGFIAASVIALAGCSEKEEAPAAPSLSVDPATVSFETAGGSSSVTIVATRDWTATSTADWVSIEPASGKGSNDDQQVTVTVLSNSGTDRTAEVKFSIGFDDKVLTVAQAGEAGSAEAAIVYKNDFDKEVAAKTYGSGSSWPYLDQFDGWKNASGTGIGSETYAYSGVSARANTTSNSNLADYAGSGNNNLFFGSSAYFSVSGLKLGDARNYTLSFGAEKYSQDGNNVFSHSEFHVYVGDGSGKWVELEYAFAKGTDPEGRWDLASTNFTLPAATTALSIYVKADAASVYRLDDLSLTISSEAGTVIDFSKGVDLGGGSGSGENPGGNTPGETTRMSITDMCAAADSVGVASEEILVGAVTTKGFVATDGKAHVYVYQNDTPSVNVGDKVTFTGMKVSYYGMPEIISPKVTSVSTGNTVPYPDAKDITATFGSYDSTTAEYVTYEAVMYKSGSYTNFRVEGADIAGALSSAPSSVYDAIKEGDKVKITGYFNGINKTNNLLNVIVVEVKVLESSGTPDTPDTGEYASNVSWTLGENSYSDQATVNKVKNVSVLKLGKSSAAGSATITLPKGTTKLNYYGVSWKAKAATLSIKVSDTENYTQELATNEGASNNSPYTITVSSSDYYTFNLPAALTEDTTITVTTSGSNYRVILFGIKAE